MNTVTTTTHNDGVFYGCPVYGRSKNPNAVTAVVRDRYTFDKNSRICASANANDNSDEWEVIYSKTADRDAVEPLVGVGGN